MFPFTKKKIKLRSFCPTANVKASWNISNRWKTPFNDDDVFYFELQKAHTRIQKFHKNDKKSYLTMHF